MAYGKIIPLITERDAAVKLINDANAEIKTALVAIMIDIQRLRADVDELQRRGAPPS